jgi:predicted SAM-dependent methyltransferase
VSSWINLGCGPFPAPAPWVNVDELPLDGVDVMASICDLPFDDGSAERIYAGHVFEHLTYLDQLPIALEEMKRILAPGGTMMVVGPDLRRALDGWPHEVDGMWPTDPHGEHPQAHSWPPTNDMQRDALVHAGFEAVELPIAEVREPWPVVSHIGWQFAFECTL